MRILTATAILTLALGFMGCEPEKTETETSSAPIAAAPTQPDQAPGAQDHDVVMPKDGDEVAVVTTNLGTVILAFAPDKAPNHVKNFKDLANKKFYDGTHFHRVIPGFMIQGGDPNSKNPDRTLHGMGDPGYKVNAEFNDIKHVRGVLSMARSQDPNSAGSQFFIMVTAKDFLDGQYTAFGHVVKGMDVVDKIVALPRDANDNPLTENPAKVESVRVVKWPVK